MSTNVWMSFFARVALVYQKQISEPHWTDYPHADSEPVEALGIFLEEYAFEWSGRPQSWPIVASDVIRSFLKRPLGGVSPSDCWGQFRQNLKSEKLNAAHNPMAPKGTPVNHRSRSTKSLSAIEFAQNDVNNPKGLIAWTLDALATDRVKDVHERICCINGVGPKIASFFLRDVAVRYDKCPVNDRYLLQPVDIWIRRSVGMLGGPTESDESTARWIVQSTDQPELVNQGIWYFGAKVVMHEFVLDRIISLNVNAAEELMRKYVAGFRDAANAWK